MTKHSYTVITIHHPNCSNIVNTSETSSKRWYVFATNPLHLFHSPFIWQIYHYSTIDHSIYPSSQSLSDASPQTKGDNMRTNLDSILNYHAAQEKHLRNHDDSMRNHSSTVALLHKRFCQNSGVTTHCQPE